MIQQYAYYCCCQFVCIQSLLPRIPPRVCTLVLFIDYIITDAQLLTESGDVHIDSTDNGMSDHFLELGRISRERTIRQ